MRCCRGVRRSRNVIDRHLGVHLAVSARTGPQFCFALFVVCVVLLLRRLRRARYYDISKPLSFLPASAPAHGAEVSSCGPYFSNVPGPART